MAGKTHFLQIGGNASSSSNYGQTEPVGNVFYVDSTKTGATDSTSYGYSPEAPFATIAYALATAAVANNGDLVRVMPGHVETVVGAAGIAMSKAGVTLRGEGTGRLRPVITFTTAAAASFDITAANCLLQNIVFVAGINAQTAMVNVTAADVAFENCEFAIDNGTTISVLLGILTAATATRLRVERCRFLGTAAATTAVTACIQHESGTDYLIRDCHFIGKMTQAILNVATVLRGMIDNNRFVIGTGTVGVTMASASTPFITNNNFNLPSGTTPIVAAAGFVSRNNYSAAAGVTAGTASTI